MWLPDVPGVLHRPRLPDHRDLDLTRVGQLGLDLLGHVARHPQGLVVSDTLGFDHDPQLPAGLDGEDLLDALQLGGQALELLETLDVVLEDLPPRARTGCRQGVGSSHQHGLHRLRVVVAVVALHGVDDRVALAELAEQVTTEVQVSSLHLPVHRLADVVNQARPLGDLSVGPQLGGHVVCEPGDLHRVLESVLAVGRAELESTEHP